MSVAKLNELRARWLLWLNDHPNHAIWDQIMLAWGARSLFWAINHMRGLGADQGGSSANNGIIADIMDHGYSTTQIMRISRLVDGGPDAISFRSILLQIKKNRMKITRESMIYALDIPYDYKNEREMRSQKFAAWISEDPKREEDAHEDKFGISKTYKSENFHTDWDKLSCTDIGSRSKDDRISCELIDILIKSLGDAVPKNRIGNYRNNIIAHGLDKCLARNELSDFSSL